MEMYLDLLLAPVGLGLVLIGWLVQLNSSLKGKKEISPVFAALDAIGVFLLVVGSYRTGDLISALLNLGIAVSSIFVLASLQLKTKRR